MKKSICGNINVSPVITAGRALLFFLAVMGVTGAPILAWADDHGSNHYKQTNLVSDQEGKAMLVDSNLVNAGAYPPAR